MKSVREFNVFTSALKRSISIGAVLLLAACIRELPEVPQPTPPTDSITLEPDGTALPFLLIDANPVMSGICFESAYDAAGRTFVLRNADELNSLFNESDNSGYCRRPAVRGTFDFSNGRAIIGTWSRGRGCEAEHRITDVDIDNVARTFIIHAQFIVEGDCPYDLVRPLWLGVTGYRDYDIRLLVEG
jgi:hypothetical protein